MRTDKVPGPMDTSKLTASLRQAYGKCIANNASQHSWYSNNGGLRSLFILGPKNCYLKQVLSLSKHGSSDITQCQQGHDEGQTSGVRRLDEFTKALLFKYLVLIIGF